MSNHTPTPWKIDGNKLVNEFGATLTVSDNGTAWMAELANVLNSHDVLVAALKRAQYELEKSFDSGNAAARNQAAHSVLATALAKVQS